jgi:hypothetical protein
MAIMRHIDLIPNEAQPRIGIRIYTKINKNSVTPELLSELLKVYLNFVIRSLHVKRLSFERRNRLHNAFILNLNDRSLKISLQQPRTRMPYQTCSHQQHRDAQPWPRPPE